MSSIIEGYNYDVFISYRQKDNKGDKWVSKFVESLKTELEATFKEEVSVYFDENLQDRLQETHHVNKSLEGKLECVIFIPILSQTYCDPKSYAWKNEFLTFLRMAESNSLGRDIKLRSGNVASRILPVRIHELEQEDIKLFERETGSVLRAMDFVFKTASGVNRPLNAHEEHPHDNLNKTYYNDQINKVAHAIREIITAIEHYDSKFKEFAEKQIEPVKITRKSKKTTIIAESILVLALIILGILFIPKLFRSEEEPEKSIAVLPFKYLSDEPDKQYLADGMMDAILLHLSKIEDLRVLDRTSVEQYRGTTKTTLQISKELGVVYVLEGTFQKHEDNVRLIVQLINTSEEGHVWANEYNNKWDEIFSVQSEVAQTIAKELNAAITPEEKQLIEEIPTKNFDAYDYYLLGLNRLANHIKDEDTWKAIEYFQQSVILDSAYVLGYTGLANAYYQLVNYAIASPNEAFPKAHEFSIKALELNARLAESHSMLGLIKESFEYDFIGAEEEYRQALAIDPENFNALLYYSRFLLTMGRYNEANEHAQNSLKLSPMSYDAKVTSYKIQYYAGYKNEAMKSMENYRDSSPDNPYGYWHCAVFYTDLGMYNEALSDLHTQVNLMGNDNISDEIGLQGYLYGQLGQTDKAIMQLDKLDSLSLEGYYIAPRTTAWVYLGINNVDKAIEILEHSFKDRTFDPGYLKNYPTVLVDEDIRFIELRKIIGLWQ